ncbi:MAG: hypothetical protein OEW85_14135, partial [Acidimicrobiia bacterium]|nr:hypothetical protein [Acidimicrobiia bacterium]
ARDLEGEGLVHLGTYHGKRDLPTLLPRLPIEDVGLVTIWYYADGGYIQFWRTVFERRAPYSLARVEREAHPAQVGKGTGTKKITEGLLEALTEAYREAHASITGT